MSRLLAWASRLPPGVQTTLKSLPGAAYLRMLAAGTPRLDGPAAGERRAVVYLPTWVRWDSMRQRPQYLLSAFAKAGHPVYFVDPREGGARMSDGVHIVASLRDVPRSGVLLYVHFAPVRRMFRLFRDPAVVYDILDDLSIYERSEADIPARNRVAAHHPNVMDEADVVIASNEVLAERHGPRRPDLLLVENGVDVDMFATPMSRPTDLPSGPIVGYHGAIAPWFDFDLFEAVARSAPDLQFVLVGPVDPEAAADTARVDRLENVTVLGEKPSRAMPGYVQAFDIGAIWFRVDHMTRGVTPLKMFECLAAGTPCVATPLPACVEEPSVRTAGGPHEFLGALREVLEGAETETSAEASVDGVSWESRLAPVLSRLEALGLDRVG
ncbi:putative teichuronic acid biosynthesis glycosyltransferase TuaH [bacterium BMS3Bbin01]|nr:putative teichuronic acid biosynthesis glycosyltransferase TuaH [bacterium BMS3Bbin01]